MTWHCHSWCLTPRKSKTTQAKLVSSPVKPLTLSSAVLLSLSLFIQLFSPSRLLSLSELLAIFANGILRKMILSFILALLVVLCRDQIMDYESLPHFCRKEGSGSSRRSSNGTSDCFSLDHDFHQQMYLYIKQKSLSLQPPTLIPQGSFHVEFPTRDAEGVVIAETIESELNKLGERNGLSHSLNGLKINGV